MKTKNKLTIFLAGLILVTFSSCSFLEEDPRSEFAGDYYKDAATLRSGVVGAYAKLRDLYVVGTNTPLFVTMLGTDECMYRGSNNVRASIDRYIFTPTDGCIREYWAQYYDIIARSNAIITQAPKINGLSESDFNFCVGNARFLRAYAYFRMVQTFGAIPLIDKQMEDFDYGIPRSPVKNVYALIISDLTDCVEHNLLTSEVLDGYANHWAAETLLGKVYLTMASAKAADRVAGYQDIELSINELYDKALKALQDVKDNSGRDLLAVYGDVFQIENKNTNKESLWEIQFSSEVPYGSQWSKEFGAYASGYDSQNLAGGWRSNGIAGQSTINFVPNFRNYYNSDGYDKRRAWNLADSIVIFDKATNKPTAYRAITATSSRPPLGDITNANTIQFSGITKYRWGDDWRSESPFVYSNCPNNVIALRFADVLLMYAEADLGKNGSVSTEGLAAINRVVQRARGQNVTEAETPGFPDYTDLTIDHLLMERARELCFEGHRWFDLARTGKLEQFLDERNNTPNSRAVTEFKSDRHYVFPIPLTEIQISTHSQGMYQNPNYGN
ncbi:MAG: RagB/SusD family nutrient uptake outer membrane protein [Candidatus Symbiothrix sp.]|jgi:hypothetical protein|nr:RagB/SusD family nutrient uptake outer membrane protein [Candidatus Symbiothrix sp.]